IIFINYISYIIFITQLYYLKCFEWISKDLKEHFNSLIKAIQIVKSTQVFLFSITYLFTNSNIIRAIKQLISNIQKVFIYTIIIFYILSLVNLDDLAQALYPNIKQIRRLQY